MIFTGYGNLCPDGWIPFENSFSSGYTCIEPVADNDITWPEAKRNCHRKEGHLLKMDSINEYNSRNFPEPIKSMGEYLFDKGKSKCEWHNVGVF